MEIVRMMPSDPRYEYVNQLTNLIAIAKNPQVWFCGLDEFDNPLPIDVDETQRQKIIEVLEIKLTQLLNGADIETLQTDRDFDLINQLKESENIAVSGPSTDTDSSEFIPLPVVFERFFRKLDKKLELGENDIGPVELPEIFVKPVKKLEAKLHHQYQTSARIDFSSDINALGPI